MTANDDLTEKRNALRKLEKEIYSLQTSYRQAKRELGETTLEDIQRAHRNGLLSDEQAEEFKTAISMRQVIVNTHPGMIEECEMQREILLDKIRRLEKKIR